MRRFRGVRRAFRWPWRTPAQEVDDEMEFHLDMRIAELEAGGMDQRRAREMARAEFGDFEAARAALAENAARSSRQAPGESYVDLIGQDLRIAVRSLRRAPGYVAVVLTALAVGIGATTAVFSVVDGVLFKPLPYPRPERLFGLFSAHPRQGDFYPMSHLDATDLAEQGSSVADIAIAHGDVFVLKGPEIPERVLVAMVTPGFLDILGAPPLMGRTFTDEEERGVGEPVVVMSHAAWRKRLGSDPDAIGRPLTIGRTRYTVIGVMPPGVSTPQWADLWTPLARTGATMPSLAERNYRVDAMAIARLKDGVDVNRATTELAGVAGQLAAAYPAENEGWTTRLVPLRDLIVGDSTRSLLTLLGAVALVLLIACANVINMVLVRATARARELAVRSALGAGRGRLVTQLLVESSLLAVAGAALGALFADWAVRALVAASPSGLPRVAEMAVDGRALAFAAAVAVGVALLTGIVPALRATRLDLLASLREGAPAAGTSESAGRLRASFVIAQVSLALVLLVGAGLLLKSFARLQAEELGFDPDRIVALRLHPDAERYDTPEESMNLYRAVVERVASIPGVDAVSYINFMPVTTVGVPTRLTIPGREPAPDEAFSADYNLVSPDFFAMLGIPIRMGRGIEPGDMNESSTAIVINETLARQYWPGANPVGRPLTVYKQVSGRPDFKQPVHGEVVGVVGDVRSAGPGVPVGPEVFLPFARNPWRNVFITIRTKGAPEPMIGQIRRAALAVDPNLPVDDLQTMEEMLALRLANRRLDTALLGSFAAAALLLAAVGIYGVVAYAVSQRHHEIGVRMALGATPGGVVRLVVRQGLVLSAAGVAIGTLGALALSTVLEGQLYEVSAVDPVVYASIALLLLGVATLASAVPAIRASRLDPSRALRQD